MPSLFTGSLLVGLLLLAGSLARSHVGRKRIHANVFTNPPLGPARPSDVGLEYRQLRIPLNDRVLQAWFVPAPQPIAAALFFHGQNDALSSLVAAIDRLHRQQITVMVFDYSGHGESTGTPTIERVRADSIAAYALFRQQATSGPRFVIGYSLGAAVLLDAMHHQHMQVDGVILASPFASIRAVAVADGMPAWLSPIIPDVYNNIRAVARLTQPVLIVQSETDGTFPLRMAQQIQAANPRAQLQIVASPQHAEVLASPAAIGDRADTYWQAITDFITTTGRASVQ